MPQHTLAPSQLLTHWDIYHTTTLNTDGVHKSQQQQHMTFASTFSGISFHCPGIDRRVLSRKRFWKPQRLNTRSQARDCFREQTRNRRSQLSISISSRHERRPTTKFSFLKADYTQTVPTEPTSPRRSLGRIQHLKIRWPMGGITIRENWYSTRDSPEPLSICLIAFSSSSHLKQGQSSAR
jgi:hypothetical protein